MSRTSRLIFPLGGTYLRPNAKRRRRAQGKSPLDRALRLEALEDRRMLAGVVVGNNLDVVNGNTTSIANLIASPGADGISLREAIRAADATAGADVITFAAALSGQTIILGGTELPIAEAVTIDARPLQANVTIHANQLSRIFNITPSEGNFLLGGLTLTSGRSFAFGAGGGAIRSVTLDAITLDQCTVSGSSTSEDVAAGGGIFAMGAVTLTRSTISGNSTSRNIARGGGIYTRGVLTLTQSTISGNKTTGPFSDGGGIWAYHGVNGAQSTISGNSTAFDTSNGGGIFVANGAVILSSCTISGNYVDGDQSRGGGIYAGDALTLTQCTITNNSATGLASRGNALYQRDGGFNAPFTISGSIVLANVGFLASSVIKDPGSTLTMNYSMTDGTFSTGPGGNNIVTFNLELGPLADNGGPTLTHAPLAGSLAIDAGDPGVAFSPAQFDQRGAPFVRVYDADGAGGARIDIGAYERQTVAASNFVVDALGDETDGDFSLGQRSFREVMGVAFGSVGAETITFANQLTSGGPATIQLAQSEIAIRESLTINGPGAGLLMIRALDPTPAVKNGDGRRIFNIDDGTTTIRGVAISGLTLTGGDVGGHGGAIFNRENLTVSASTISGNNAGGGFGGGLYNGGANGVLSLNGVTVSNNLASFGGGVMNVLGVLAVTNSTISGNVVSGNGGGIQNNNGTLSVSHSTISGNNGAGAGGGILSYYDGFTTLTNVTISGNVATQGGGLWARASHVNVAFSTITENSASGTGVGGGVRLIYPVGTTLDHVLMAGNIGSSSPRDDIAGAVTVRFSLIGDSTGAMITNNGGNLIGTSGSPIIPLLGPLANNGGPTQTHAPLLGGPAINAGDPSIVFSPTEFDQRGAPYVRVSGGRVDIGAFELQTTPVSADFDVDSDVDGADFLAWQRGLGLTGAAATRANGNSDNDNDVDAADLAAWKAQFGVPTIAAVVVPQSAALREQPAPPPPLSPSLVDAAMAWQSAYDARPARTFAGRRAPRSR